MTTTMKYTELASCPYAKSYNTGCTSMVMWKCRKDSIEYGPPLEMDGKDRDGFPAVHDCRPPAKVDRVPDPQLEVEEYRKLVNERKDKEWRNFWEAEFRKPYQTMNPDHGLKKSIESPAPFRQLQYF